MAAVGEKKVSFSALALKSAGSRGLTVPAGSSPSLKRKGSFNIPFGKIRTPSPNTRRGSSCSGSPSFSPSATSPNLAGARGRRPTLYNRPSIYRLVSQRATDVSNTSVSRKVSAAPSFGKARASGPKLSGLLANLVGKGTGSKKRWGTLLSRANSQLKLSAIDIQVPKIRPGFKVDITLWDIFSCSQTSPPHL